MEERDGVLTETKAGDGVQAAYNLGQAALAARSDAERKQHGQYLTPPAVARFMARCVGALPDAARVLDPAIGSGVLAAAIVERAVTRGYPRTLSVVGYDVDAALCDLARDVLAAAQARAARHGIALHVEVRHADFVLDHVPTPAPGLFTGDDGTGGDGSPPSRFDAIVSNPPYFKLGRDDARRRAVEGRIAGHTNIYTVFMGLAARLLAPHGRSAFLVPRSFCSGAYFKTFRTQFLRHAVPRHVHLFDARDDAFDADAVLQENVVFAFGPRDESAAFDELVVSTSRGVSDLTRRAARSERLVPSSVFVGRGPRSIYYRLPTSDLDARLVALVDAWPMSLARLGLDVSTGPVVPFRSRELLTDADAVAEGRAVPLYWMQNVTPGALTWPTARGNKPQGLLLSDGTEALRVPAQTSVVIRRFSAKEDVRRLTAAPFLASAYAFNYVGLENHLNYVHRPGGTLSDDEAVGLATLLNSAVVDRYFRILNGNTQVNATDLKALQLPTRATIEALGRTMRKTATGDAATREAAVFDTLRQAGLLPDDLPTFTETRFRMGNIQDAQYILKTLGLPPKQQNEMAALTLLVLAGLGEDDAWSEVESLRLGIHDMMQAMATTYDRRYAENTRETVRRQVIHQFEQAGLVERNPDDPDLPTNSPKTHYALSDAALATIRAYGTDDWIDAATAFLENRRALIERYRQQREQAKVPLTLPSGEAYRLSPGAHNELQASVIEDFGPRFAPGARVLYVGDTANKTLHLDEDAFADLALPVPSSDKLPDVVLHDPDRDWLYLIEAVTSHGPVTPKRQVELRDLMLRDTATAPIFVSAFPDFATFRDFLADIAWETEVWIAERPSHLIHFNGDRLLHPHAS